jgi:hypothetical protein
MQIVKQMALGLMFLGIGLALTRLIRPPQSKDRAALSKADIDRVTNKVEEIIYLAHSSIPEGMGVIVLLSKEEHEALPWDPTDIISTAKAKLRFNELIEDKYAMIKVSSNLDSALETTDFDPYARVVLAVRNKD